MKGKLLNLPPPTPEAWCYTCRAMTKYCRPIPPLKYPHPTVTLLEGICASCGGVLWRVGGARTSEGIKDKDRPDEDKGMLTEDESPSFDF